MKSVLISIQPKWCEFIANKEKTIEVRKTRPKIDTPFKCYIYQTKSLKDNTAYSYETWARNGKVIGEFVCARISEMNSYCLDGEDRLKAATCLDDAELMDYVGYLDKTFYLWHISDLVIYDEPKELRGFYKPCIDKYQYCQGCRYGSVIISPDEEEYALYHGGHYDTFDTVCCNYLTRPPQSWCYVEELR